MLVATRCFFDKGSDDGSSKVTLFRSVPFISKTRREGILGNSGFEVVFFDTEAGGAGRVVEN